MNGQQWFTSAMFGVFDPAEPGHHGGAVDRCQAFVCRVTIEPVAAGQALAGYRRSACERGEEHVPFTAGHRLRRHVVALLIVALTLTPVDAALRPPGALLW